MKQVLFVCTGNTCRSCMAEAIFNYSVENDSDIAGEILAASAGVAAFSGEPASSNAVAALREEWGIDLSTHRARAVSRQQIENAGIILTMTRGHKEALAAAFPDARSRMYTLKEFAAANDENGLIDEYNYGLDISDPYGMPLQVYKKCAHDIKCAVDEVIAKLKNGNTNGGKTGI